MGYEAAEKGQWRQFCCGCLRLFPLHFCHFSLYGNLQKTLILLSSEFEF